MRREEVDYERKNTQCDFQIIAVGIGSHVCFSDFLDSDDVV